MKQWAKLKKCLDFKILFYTLLDLNLKKIKIFVKNICYLFKFDKTSNFAFGFSVSILVTLQSVAINPIKHTHTHMAKRKLSKKAKDAKQGIYQK